MTTPMASQIPATERRYPSMTEYNVPKKNVLVISCIDLRLTDDLVKFLHFDNLQNRYDHFILAGSSLLCYHNQDDLILKNIFDEYKGWSKTLNDHIKIAIKLHEIRDIYIVEHQDCGAYDNFLDKKNTEVQSLLKDEKMCHKKFALELADKIQKEHYVNVHAFFIDLRGNVSLLETIPYIAAKSDLT
jgi:carbonic anhydrase